MKRCSLCLIEQPLGNFNKNGASRGRTVGLRADCKSCQKKAIINWRNLNDETTYRKEYNLTHKDMRNAYSVEYGLTHKAERNIKRRHRYATDPVYRTKINVTNMLKYGLTNAGLQKSFSTFEWLGFTARQCYEHLAQYIYKFCEECKVTIITFENSHTDHIIAQTNAIDKQGIWELNQLHNLRLICKPCNLKKHDSTVFTLGPVTQARHKQLLSV